MSDAATNDFGLVERYDRDRTKNALAFAAVSAERDALHRQLAEARRWIENCVDPVAVGVEVKQSMLDKIDAALAAASVSPQPETPKIVCGECGYDWPRSMMGPPYYDRTHGQQIAESDCDGLFTVVPHFPTPCECNPYGRRRCPVHVSGPGPVTATPTTED